MISGLHRIVSKRAFLVCLAGIWKKARCLTFFQDPGPSGLEAISRGAEKVYFVDNSLKSIKLIKSNLELLKDKDCECKVIKSDISRFLEHFEDFTADFIFLDPPYKIETMVMRDIFSITVK